MIFFYWNEGWARLQVRQIFALFRCERAPVSFVVPNLQLQREMAVAVGSHDPAHMWLLLARAPFHPPLLLQLSEMCALSGRMARAAELVERCERAVHRPAGRLACRQAVAALHACLLPHVWS
jgi:hypothetical protein